MNGTVYLALIFLCALFEDASSAKILAIMLVPSTSHLFWYSKYLRGLLARGHEITYIGVDRIVPGDPRLRQITFDKMREDVLGSDYMVQRAGDGPIEASLMLDRWDHDVSEYVKKSAIFRDVLRIVKTERFDLVLHDISICMFMIGAANLSGKDTPVVGLTPFGRPSWVLDVLENPVMYSSHPHSFLPYGEEMSFIQRVNNVLFYMFSWITRSVYMIEQNILAKDAFGNDLEPLEKILGRMNIIMVNSNEGLDFPYPKVPGLIHVGGLHIDPPKPLPEEIRSYLDNATHGAVYFSLGTNIFTSHLSKEKLAMLSDAFRQLAPVRILIKWETDENVKMPENVKLLKWIPQNDVLAHPNVVLFFTHSGLLSTQEAVYHGVPLLGMPFALDQHANLKKCTDKGMAEGLDYTTMTTEIVLEKMRKIIGDPKYKENAKKLSAIYRDTMEKPLDKAIFWTEYALRHKGAPHLSLFARRMAWYEKTQLDVCLFLLILLLHILFVVFKVLQWLWRRWRKEDTKTKTS
ncbi:UNVERIFIED_CONTAM: hypothetical protein PYX00_004135 [Menopon gallinae]|uniref:UDP-glucuronosyltransferase n=1 Tax=Menopon gallinae TaxID=328185 RepID=A0AAW2I3Y4_9NEOP